LAEHVVELQLIVAALEGAGFCKAWEGMRDLWVKRDKDAEKKMKDLFISTVKLSANALEGQFYVEKSINAEVRCTQSLH
jgi:hypothetical protein